MCTINKLEREFPEYSEKYIPNDAEEKSLLVYRACKTMKCDKESFMDTYEENGYKIKTGNREDPENYSLSVYTQPKDVKRFVSMNADHPKPYKIAKGGTEACCGVIRCSENKRSSHVDWWLYKAATPYVHFEIIPNFMEYIKKSKKGK